MLCFVSRFNLLTSCHPEFAFRSDKVELLSHFDHVKRCKSTDGDCSVEVWNIECVGDTWSLRELLERRRCYGKFLWQFAYAFVVWRWPSLFLILNKEVSLFLALLFWVS